MKIIRSAICLALTGAISIGALPTQASAQERAGSRPTFAADGTVHVPPFDLPPSVLMSKEASAMLRARAGAPSSVMPATMDIATLRMGIEMVLAPAAALMRLRYPADIVHEMIGGVPTRVVTPRGVKTASDRVLIDLHGGGFSTCTDACGILESLPIAAVGGYKVVSVDYRQGPEAKFPAASEDIAAVYRALLKTYKPSQIGIYGCSAGGALSAQIAAWLPKHDLPQAGAIGIFGSGGTFSLGDSAYFAGYADGAFPPPPLPGADRWPVEKIMMTYFDGVDTGDAMVSPANHPEILAGFPPTLILTGTRAPDMSTAVYTHSQLIKAGVPGDLIVGEGMGHCYMYYADVPEARDAYAAIANFFKKYLH